VGYRHSTIVGYGRWGSERYVQTQEVTGREEKKGKEQRDKRKKESWEE
jgi:hypothetical protein